MDKTRSRMDVTLGQVWMTLKVKYGRHFTSSMDKTRSRMDENLGQVWMTLKVKYG